MTFAIGDIHGELSKLKLLIKNILSLDKSPELVFIGDYIDKGENPHGTLTYLEMLSNDIKCIFLMGNHEYYWMLLDENKAEIKDYLLRYGALTTLESFSEKHDLIKVKKFMLERFKAFFNSLEPFYVNEKFIVVHSGIDINYFTVPIDKIPVTALLFNRYDFIKKASLYYDKTIIFGHTGFLHPYYDGFKIGIDTASCFLREQPLTAFCLEKDFFVDSNNCLYHLTELNRASCPIIPRNIPWRLK